MSHDDRELEFVRGQLRSAMPPLLDPELKADLWPSMLRRLEEPPLTFGWFESILVGVVALTFVIFPSLLPAMLYHL
jgi:hypothetical protein